MCQMSTTVVTHPYFVAWARDWMRRVGGDPACAGELARWAEIARLAGMRGRGVIVAADGTLLAETWQSRGRLTCRYVDTADLARLTGTTWYPNVLDMAMGAIRRAVGQGVAHASYWDVCTGHAVHEEFQ